MQLSLTIDELKEKILPFLKKCGISNAGIFGSFVRGDLDEESDIDIVIEFEKDITLFDFIDIKLELEEILNKKADLVEYSALKPFIRDSILKEQVIIL
ncbi:hypothetical protein ES705_22678 [subsurface metagenome]|jgi:predicted nucleotidyltransferase